MPEIELQPIPERADMSFGFFRQLFKRVGIKLTMRAIQSDNFVSGSAGWRITAAGNFEANAGTFRGALVANSVDIPDTTTANSFHIDSSGNMWLGATTFASAPAKISNAGALTVTSGAIGGWTISSTAISSAASGERIILDQGNRQIELYNSSGNVVYRLKYGATTSAAYQLMHIQNDARRGIEFIVGSTLGSDAKCITIDNPSTSICIDMTDAGGVGINIAGASTSGITITHGGTGPGISISASGSAGAALDVGGGDYPAIEVTQNGTATNSYGIRITQGATGLKEGLFIDGNADSHLAECIYLDRDGNSASDVAAMIIESSNAGGSAVGIDLTQPQHTFKFAADAYDPTNGGGAAAGRIPIKIGSTTKYLAYY